MGVLLLPLGVVVSHALGYVLAGIDPAGRAHAAGLLHGDIGVLLALTIVAGLLGVAVEMRSSSAAFTSWQMLFALLAGSQMAAYALMEVGQRLGHGMSLAAAVGDPAIRWGLVVQLVASAVACLLIGLTCAVAAALGRARGRSGALVRPTLAAPLGVAVATRPWSPCSRRGPPTALSPTA